jgi:hypothetical protein
MSYVVDGVSGEVDMTASEELPANWMEMGKSLLLPAVETVTMQLGRFCLTTGSKILSICDLDSAMGSGPVES